MSTDDPVVLAERGRINALLVAIREHWIKANGEDSLSVTALDTIAEVIADGGYVKQAESDAAKIKRLEAERNAAQAKIDALMLEYCPDKMTPEQVAEWVRHQRSAVEPDAVIDTARKPEPAEPKRLDLLSWAVQRWHDEVFHRPMVNKHRRTLDDTWRQVIRFADGDPDKLIGPDHDTLAARSAP